MQIKRITRFHKKALADMNGLLGQWSDSGYQMAPAYFKQLIKKSHVLALYDDNTIIGTVTIIEIYKLSGLKGSVEHLMVDEKYRGRKLGQRLMTFAIAYAKKQKMQTLFLTCESHRAAATMLYKKLGFAVKDTNFYFLNLKK